MAVSEFIHRVETRQLRSPEDYIVLAAMGFLTLAVVTGVVVLIIANLATFLMLVAALSGVTAVVLIAGLLCYLVGLHVDVPILKKLYEHETQREMRVFEESQRRHGHSR